MNESKKNDIRFEALWKKFGAIKTEKIRTKFPGIRWNKGFRGFEGEAACLKLREETRAPDKKILLIHSCQGKQYVVYEGYEAFAACTHELEGKTVFQVGHRNVPIAEKFVWPPHKEDPKNGIYPLLAVEYL